VNDLFKLNIKAQPWSYDNKINKINNSQAAKRSSFYKNFAAMQYLNKSLIYLSD